jgi:hypothetical protein
MKKILSIIVLILVAISSSTCKKIIFREIDCRAFTLTEEYYWNSVNNGDSIVFINSSNKRNKFIVVDKRISHRKKYTSDTGCGCLDESSMLMTNNSDSIWFKNELRYVEDQAGKRYQDVVIVLNGKQSGFYETHMTTNQTYSIDSLTFTNVRKFEYAYTDNSKVKTMYFAKNLGIIRFEEVNGEVWTNENLSDLSTTSIETFTYSENTCE